MPCIQASGIHRSSLIITNVQSRPHSTLIAKHRTLRLGWNKKGDPGLWHIRTKRNEGSSPNHNVVRKNEHLARSGLLLRRLSCWIHGTTGISAQRELHRWVYYCNFWEIQLSWNSFALIRQGFKKVAPVTEGGKRELTRDIGPIKGLQQNFSTGESCPK